MNLNRAMLTAISATALLITGSVQARPPAAEPNLVEVAQAVNDSGPYAGLFDLLLAIAGNDPEIVETLTSKGQNTVFAPIDPAFEDLLANAAANCVVLSDDLVNAVLKYHLAVGRRDSTQVVASDQIRTSLGVSFQQAGGVITDGAGEHANIIVVDVPASNGIIHAIDKVLLPFPLPNLCN